MATQAAAASFNGNLFKRSEAEDFSRQLASFWGQATHSYCERDATPRKTCKKAELAETGGTEVKKGKKRTPSQVTA